MVQDENLENSIETENEDISALDTQKAYYENIIAQKDAKYGTLLKAYARGERAEAPAPVEPTAEELKTNFENNVRFIRDNKGLDIDQAKKLIEIQDYRLAQGEKSIFLPQDGTPSQEELDSAEKVEELLRSAIETSDGDNGMFVAMTNKYLVDNRNLR